MQSYLFTHERLFMALDPNRHVKGKVLMEWVTVWLAKSVLSSVIVATSKVPLAIRMPPKWCHPNGGQQFAWFCEVNWLAWLVSTCTKCTCAAKLWIDNGSLSGWSAPPLVNSPSTKTLWQLLRSGTRHQTESETLWKLLQSQTICSFLQLASFVKCIKKASGYFLEAQPLHERRIWLRCCERRGILAGNVWPYKISP